MTDVVTFSNLDEPLFADSGATKRDLVTYLEAVHAELIADLRNRPLSVIRAVRGQHSSPSCRRTCPATPRRGCAP